MATALQHVAVVGAGAAGLCAARRILSRPDRFAPPVLFELSANVGGTWCYEERVGTYDDGRPILSSMYRHLRTNLPKEVMMFPDFPFEEQPSSFLPHQEVRRYLETYCDNYKISPHIRFSTVVEDVKAVVMTTGGEEEQTTWEALFRSVHPRCGRPGQVQRPGSSQPCLQECRCLLRSLCGRSGSASVRIGHFLGVGQRRRSGDLESRSSSSHLSSSGCDQTVQSGGGGRGRRQNSLPGRLAEGSRCPALLHRIQVQLSLPGCPATGFRHSGPLGGTTIPFHDAARLSLAFLYWNLQDHLPLPLLRLPSEEGWVLVQKRTFPSLCSRPRRYSLLCPCWTVLSLCRLGPRWRTRSGNGSRRK
ncbi:uncharacterized protein LOC129168703 isoform X4 [Dunckerocampus dactyliophorus]|uniref:uncharacterized protein LOC129168703 isoform X4 n=1 Tax=Dunckerocampus dactyliophorus TaxID=161453 RepID=UPI002406E27A|nr:uncharacterized protein LOC129168703 isoform X4 [Dunckerocampus dactyliophorus]